MKARPLWPGQYSPFSRAAASCLNHLFTTEFGLRSVYFIITWANNIYRFHITSERLKMYGLFMFKTNFTEDFK